MVWRNLMRSLWRRADDCAPGANFQVQAFTSGTGQAHTSRRSAQLISRPHISLATAVHARSIAEMSREYIEYGLGWSWTQARVLKAIQDDSTNVAVVQERAAVVAF